ncbi:MAG: thiolase family protein [Actinomycetota bacterium]
MSSSERGALILDAARTPFGRDGGALSGIRADDLAALPVASLMDRWEGPIDDVVLGATNQAGEDNRNVARMAALLSGLPVTTPGVTVNRLCGSGSEALVHAARLVRCGEAERVIAGGVESMSSAPFVVERSRGPLDRELRTHRTTVGWRMVNPRYPEHWTDSLGACAERVAVARGVSREAMDDWAVRSHERAAAAWRSGFHGAWTLTMEELEQDESVRADISRDALASLRPAFTKDGSVTAGNSSPISDGAVAVLLGPAGVHGAESAVGEIVTAVTVGVEPDEFAIAPLIAMRALLHREGLSWGDIGVFEIQEAFAGVVLACLADEPAIDPDRVNPFGGALALGHPLGASAARLVVDTCRALRERGGGWGLASICIGVGQGQAVLVRVD